MASILRSSKFVRYFAAVARNIVINQPREVDGTLVHRSQVLANYIQKDFVTTAPAISRDPSLRSIDKSIKRLDEDVRRTGRISRRELLEVIDEIRSNKHATGTQSLMVIRCCGNLVPEEIPEVRTKLVKEVWQTFENLGIIMDISHYNALLRVYLENEHKFSPSEFLADLETKGVEPNRVTFQRLIAAYCQQGDIDGATRILEFMREKQLPVNESVFNALVMGHSQADDMESAKGILGVMKQAGIEPSAETYVALLCGYAKKGDMDTVQNVFTECKQAGIELMDKDLLDIVYTLAISGHSKHLDNILAKMTKTPGYNQDAKNTVLRLVARGEDKAAMKVLKSMTNATSQDGQQILPGSFLLRQMVRSNRPIESVLSVCESLKTENERALAVATEASLFCGNTDLSLKLLSALAKQEPVCQHYYWPVIVQYGKAQNRQGILQTLRQMSSDIGQPVSGETLREYVVQYLASGEAGIHELRQAGISLASAAAAIVGHTLQRKDLQGAARLALQYRANYNSLAMRRALVSAYLADSDANSLVTLVQILEEGNGTTSAAVEEDEDSDEVAGKVLLGIVSALRKDRVSHTSQILQKYLEHGIGISNSTAELLQNKLNGDELTKEISTLLSKLTSPELIPTALNRPAPSKMLHVKDEDTLLRSISAVESRGESSVALKRQLLTLYCHNKDLDKAVKLKQAMEAEGFEFQVGLLSLLLDLYTAHDMLPEAMEHYNRIMQKESNAQIDESKLIRLANLLVKNDRTEEAIELFKNRKFTEDELNGRNFQHSSLCWKLLNTLAEKGDVENLNTIFEVMKQNNFITPSNVLLGPLIKVHLLKNDVKGALDKFEECCLKYRSTPWKNEIACKLIEDEDAASLQKLTDLSTQIHGEVNSLYDLVLSFVECGRIRQARKILETPGLRLRAQRINSACLRYKNEGLVNHLESLVEATKDISHINRADIYYHLLTTYSNNDEVDKGLGLWTQMQDEDVQPTDQFLVTLAELLKKHNKPVPFTVPDIPLPEVAVEEAAPEVNDNKRLTPVQNHLKSLRRAIFIKDLDQALKIKEKLKDSDLLMSDRSALLNALVNSGRMGEATKLLLHWLEQNIRPNIKAFNNAVNSLAKAGDLDSMKAIGKLIDEDLKRFISYSNRLTHCMVEAGCAKDLLNTLEVNIDFADTEEKIKAASLNFPRGGIFSVFTKAPELIPHFEKVADKFRAKGVLEPTNVLWAHYMMAGDKEKAAQLWSHLQNSEKLLFQPILKLARQNKDLTLANDLLNISKQTKISPSAFGIIYGCIIDIHLLQNQFSECGAKLDEAIKICTIDNISYALLNRVKRVFEANHIPFKYTIPPKKPKMQSSSSSSDSDSETPHQASSVR